MFFIYIIRRVLSILVTLVGVSIITFIISHIIPADPIKAVAGLNPTEEQVKQLRAKYGLDKPVVEQYVRWIINAIHGDLGTSIRTGQPVLEDIFRYAPASAELAIVAMFLVALFGLPVGILSAVWKGSVFDHVTRLVAISGVSTPIFLTALGLQLIFARTGLLPIDGRIDVFIPAPPQLTGLYTVDALLAGDFVAFKSALRHLVLPALALAFGSLATLTRMVRASLLETLNDDYIYTARSKGLPERRVIAVHALRNALIPTITIMALQMGVLIGGVFIVEVIFSWPGLGFYALRAFSLVDFPAIMGVTVFMCIVYLLLNCIADILYALVDPRVILG